MVVAIVALVWLVVLSNFILYAVVYEAHRRVTAGLATKASVAELECETIRAQTAEAVMGRMVRGHVHTGAES